MTTPSTASQDRSLLHRTIRRFFENAEFLEVETPIFSPAPIPESHIELFETDRVDQAGNMSKLYLLPSPEYWMKRLLAEGYPSLFQISRCFRNGEQIDRWHRLEFTMLEWYEIGIDAEENIGRMEKLFNFCFEALGKTFGGNQQFLNLTMSEAFQEFAGFSLEKDLYNAGWSESVTGDRTDYDSRLKEVFAGRLQENNLPAGGATDSADDLFHRLFISLVEDRIPRDRPVILNRWPALVPTLAKRIPGTPWSDRWELYYKGVELANCYGEEQDLDTLKSYWSDESAKKARSLVPLETDDSWPAMIADGMPKCSGVALGLDRFLALIRGDDGLQGLDLFPINDMIRR